MILNKSKKDKNFSPFKVTIDKFDLIMSLGCNENCLRGVYLASVFNYVADLIRNLADKYVVFTSFEKMILPNFNEKDSKIMLNITIKKGVLDIIKGLISANLMRGSYANR